MLGHRKWEFLLNGFLILSSNSQSYFHGLHLIVRTYNKGLVIKIIFAIVTFCSKSVTGCLYARENRASLLNESLRGINPAEFSNSYFRQHNFLSLAPAFALQQSSQWMPNLLNKSCLRIHVGRTSLCSSVAVTAKYWCLGWYQQPWPPSSLSEKRQLGFLDWLFLVCRSCIRQNICYLC